MTAASIDNFESLSSSKSMTFQELETRGLLGPHALEVRSKIESNQMLKELYDANLLHFSTKHRAEVEATGSLKAEERAVCRRDIPLGDVVVESIRAIDEDYKKRSPLAQEFLNSSTRLLVASAIPAVPGTIAVDAPFRGLSIEAIPAFDGARSDNYLYDTRQAEISFRPLPGALAPSQAPSVLLAHEFTHAIDDICDHSKSVNRVFDTLASATGSTKPKRYDKQESMLRSAASMIDDGVKSLHDTYLPEFTTNYLKKGRDVVAAYAEDATSKVPHTRLFQSAGSRGLDVTSVPAEFLTFSAEHVFKTLNDSVNPAEFHTKYKQFIDESFTSAKKTGNVAAFGMIKDVTSAHLERIAQSAGAGSDLSECCSHAQGVLDAKYTAIGGAPRAQSVFLTTTPSPDIPLPVAAPAVQLQPLSLPQSVVISSNPPSPVPSVAMIGGHDADRAASIPRESVKRGFDSSPALSDTEHAGGITLAYKKVDVGSAHASPRESTDPSAMIAGFGNVQHVDSSGGSDSHHIPSSSPRVGSPTIHSNTKM